MLQSESSPLSNGDHRLSSMPHGIEVLLTSKEASQVLKIHPKVLERMAQAWRSAGPQGGKVLAVSCNDTRRLDQFKATIRPPTVPHANLILKREETCRHDISTEI